MSTKKFFVLQKKNCASKNADSAKKKKFAPCKKKNLPFAKKISATQKQFYIYEKKLPTLKNEEKSRSDE